MKIIINDANCGNSDNCNLERLVYYILLLFLDECSFNICRQLFDFENRSSDF